MPQSIGARNGTRVRDLQGPSTVRFDFEKIALGPIDLEGLGDLSEPSLALKKTLSAGLVGRGELSVVIPSRGFRKRLVVTDVDGTLLGELENAKIGSLIQELNRPSSWTFSLPVEDPKAALVLDEEFREVQLWRGDRLLEWGPVVRPGVTDGDLAATCMSADWHLLRRTIGKAERENLLVNGSFEDGLAGWNVLRHASTNEPSLAFILQQPTADARAFQARATAGHPVKEGRKSALLQDLSSDQKKPFIFQDVIVSTDELSERFTFTAWLYLDSSTYVEPNPRDTGLLIGALPDDYRDLNFPGSGAPLPPAGFSNMFFAARNLKFFALDFWKWGTPPDLDRWVRAEASIVVPPFQDVNIACRVETPRGGTYIDRCSLVRSENLSFLGGDQTSDIAAGLVRHGQGLDEVSGAPIPALQKSDVNIVPRCPQSGVVRDRTYLFSEHPNVYESIGEFFELRDGFDYAMEYTPTERRFVTFFPEKGRKRSKHALQLGRNVSSFAWAFDGENASSSIIILGEGSGDGREEGSAIDLDAFAGGLTLEEVLKAPDGATVESLDAFAAEELARATAPEVLAVKTHRNPRGITSQGIDGPELIGRLSKGDFVEVLIERGAFSLVGEYRIVRLTLTETDELELVLNNRARR